MTLSTIGQIAITVRDVESSTGFYRDALGLPFLFKAPPGLAFFDCGGLRLMLGTSEGKEFRPSTTFLYFRVDDIGGTHAALAARGVRFRGEPHLVAKLPDREVWIAEFEDPDGNPLALISEPKSPPGPR